METMQEEFQQMVEQMKEESLQEHYQGQFDVFYWDFLKIYSGNQMEVKQLESIQVWRQAQVKVQHENQSDAHDGGYGNDDSDGG